MATLTPWQFLIFGYLLTVAIECPVLLAGLHPRHGLRVRLFAAVWLTAVTYPIVILTLPVLTGPYYTAVAETFAPLAEIAAFRAISGAWSLRDACAIAAANLLSFGFGWYFIG